MPSVSRISFSLTVCVCCAAGAGAPPPVLGVRWQAPFLSGGGYCTEATSLLAGLTALNVTVEARQHGDSFSQAYVDGLAPPVYRLLEAAFRATGVDADTVSVCHSEPGAWHLPPSLPQRWSTSVCPHPGAPWAVGRTMFESDRLPEGWAARLNAMDAVWVPTQFAYDIFAAGGVIREKLAVVPEAVESDVFTPAAPPSSLLPARVCDWGGGAVPGSSSACPYRFLFVGKWERRKGLDVLLRAYLAEFAEQPQGGDDEAEAAAAVELYILSSSYHSSSDLDAAVDALVAGDLSCGPGVTAADVRAGAASCAAALPAGARRPPVRLLRAVPAAELPGVYTAVDAAVLPTRGEGWGRPHVEAMAAGLPVIATNWSGPTAFLDDGVGYPLAFSGLLPIPEGPFAGHLQAEPDVAHLRALMRRLVRDPAEGRSRGAAARARMIARYQPAYIAEIVRRELEVATLAVLSRAAGRPLSRGLERLQRRRRIRERLARQFDDSRIESLEGASVLDLPAGSSDETRKNVESSTSEPTTTPSPSGRVEL